MISVSRTASMLHVASRRSAASKRVSYTLAGVAGIRPSFPDRFPHLRQLLNLALSPDAETASMACRELRRRIDRLKGAAP